MLKRQQVKIRPTKVQLQTNKLFLVFFAVFAGLLVLSGTSGMSKEAQGSLFTIAGLVFGGGVIFFALRGLGFKAKDYYPSIVIEETRSKKKSSKKKKS